MKKFIKIVLCIVAGCIGMGCAALVIGFVIGKSTSSFSQNRVGYWRATIQNIRDAANGLRKGVQYWEDEQDDEDESERVSTEEATTEETTMTAQDGQNILKVDADKVQVLEVDLRHGYLGVEESEDDQIYVLLDGKKADYVQASYESGRLLIQDTRQGKAARKDIEIYLSIPEKKKFNKMELQMDAGELDMDVPLSADRIQLNADAGVITAEELSSDELDVSVGTGEIDISDSSFGKAALNCGVGIIDLEGSIRSDARAECGMGTIDLDLNENLDAYNYILNCGMGSIEIGDSSYSALTREKRIQNGADATFMLNCGMGNITIE